MSTWSKLRPQIQLRFRDHDQHERLKQEARERDISLNELLLEKIDGKKADLSKRKA